MKPFTCTQTMNSTSWNYLIASEQMSSGSFKNNITKKLFAYIIGFDPKYQIGVDMP